MDDERTAKELGFLRFLYVQTRRWLYLRYRSITKPAICIFLGHLLTLVVLFKLLFAIPVVHVYAAPFPFPKSWTYKLNVILKSLWTLNSISVSYFIPDSLCVFAIVLPAKESLFNKIRLYILLLHFSLLSILSLQQFTFNKEMFRSFFYFFAFLSLRIGIPILIEQHLKTRVKVPLTDDNKILIVGKETFLLDDKGAISYQSDFGWKEVTVNFSAANVFRYACSSYKVIYIDKNGCIWLPEGNRLRQFLPPIQSYFARSSVALLLDVKNNVWISVEPEVNENTVFYRIPKLHHVKQFAATAEHLFFLLSDNSVLRMKTPGPLLQFHQCHLIGEGKHKNSPPPVLGISKLLLLDWNRILVATHKSKLFVVDDSKMVEYAYQVPAGLSVASVELAKRNDTLDSLLIQTTNGSLLQERELSGTKDMHYISFKNLPKIRCVVPNGAIDEEGNIFRITRDYSYSNEGKVKHSLLVGGPLYPFMATPLAAP